MSFKEIKPEHLTLNPFTKIGSDWMLITAGNEDKFNSMTASWGGLGVFWGKNAATIYIRPQRYTKEFVDSSDTFTLSFFSKEYREALNICGTLSGRNCDKLAKTNLTPYFLDNTTAFQEAELIFICKKMYQDTMPFENFIAKENDAKWYPDKDYHTMYISEILKVLVKE